MSAPYVPIDWHECPDCGGEASNAEHPCTTWFTCECGFFFDSKELEKEQLEKEKQDAWWIAIDQDESLSGVEQ